MKRSWKRCLAFLLALVLAFSDVGLVRAYESYYPASASGTIGENLTWDLYMNGVLAISGTEAMPDYSSAEDTPWYSYRYQIRCVVIDDGVTHVGSNAFSGFSSITAIQLGPNVETIGTDAFSETLGLLGYSVAAGNESFQAIDDVLYNAEGTTLIACPAQKKFDGTFVIPESVKEIAPYAFYRYGNQYTNSDYVLNVQLPANLKRIGSYAFANTSCLKIVNLSFPERLEYIGDYAFRYHSLWQNMILPESVTTLGAGAFTGSWLLAKVYVPMSMTSIGENIFDNCENLTDLYYEGTEEDWAKINVHANNACLQGLTMHYSVSSGSMEVASGTRGESIAWKLTNDGTLILSGTGYLAFDYNDFSSSGLNSMADWWPWSKQGPNIKKVVIEDGIKSIGMFAFSQNYPNLEEVVMANSVTAIETGAFLVNRNLKTVTLSNQLETMASMAFQATGIESITLPATLCNLGYAGGSWENPFGSCKDLTTINVAEGNTRLIFENGNLYNADKTCLICHLVNADETSYAIPEGVSEVASYAFLDNEVIESLKLPASLRTLNSQALSNVINLKNLYVKKGLETIGMNCLSMVTLDHVYFTGSANEWSSISIESGNSYAPSDSYPQRYYGLGKAQFHYDYVAPEDITVEINEENFPDEVFRTFVGAEYDNAPKDGILNADEISAAKNLYLRNDFENISNIHSIEGIEFLSALETFNCIGKRIPKMDFSKNKKLKTVYCPGNQITSINVEGLSELEMLGCATNRLTKLSLRGCTNLKDLLCYSNSLTSLNLSETPNVKNLYLNAQPTDREFTYDDNGQQIQIITDYWTYQLNDGSLLVDKSVNVATEKDYGALIADIADLEISAQEKMEALKEEFSMEELAEAMRTTDGALIGMKLIEQQYQQENSVMVQINAYGSLYEQIDVSKISMIGAVMNATVGYVMLDIADPSQPENVPDNLENVVQFNMRLLTGGMEKSELDVPMLISMPVPEGIDMNKLVILHYLADGSSEVVEIRSMDRATREVSFVVTHFSNFVMATDTSNDDAAVYWIWGKMKKVQHEDGREDEEPDPDTLEIADYRPDDKILVAKYITGGTYVPKISDEDPTDAEIALLMNNVTIDLSKTGEDRIKRWWNWNMAGDCTVIFDGMTASTKDGTNVDELDCFPAYTEEITVSGLLGHYGEYPFVDVMDESGENVVKYHKEPCYDVTGTRTVDGPIFAGRLVINNGANLIMNVIEKGENEPTKGGQIEATEIVINGTLTMPKPDDDNAPPQIRVYEDGSLTMGANAVLNISEGTQLILHDKATVSDSLKELFYEHNDSQNGALVEHVLSADHGKELLTYSAQDGKWIYHQGMVGVRYDEWWDEHDQPTASVFVGNTLVRDGEAIAFEAGEALTISFVMPEDRAGCEPIVEFWCEDGFFSNRSTDAESKLTIENNSFTYTPKSNFDFWVNFGWSDYDFFGANRESGELLVETRGDGGSVVTNVDVDAEDEMSEPNGGVGVKKRIKIDELTNDSFTITMTPDEGRRLCNVNIWMQDHEERYTIKRDMDPKDGWQLIEDCDAFTEKDGVYTYTFKNVSQYQQDYIGFHVWFEDLKDVWPEDGKYNMNYWFFGDDQEHSGKVYLWDNNKWKFLPEHEDYDFTAGETLQFQVEIPQERTGCVPIVEIRTNTGDYFSTFDNMDKTHKLALTKADEDLYTFAFTPVTNQGFEVQVHWSDYDYAWYDEGDFILYTGHSGEGTVELVGNAFYDSMAEPASDADGAKHWYHNADLKSGDGVSVVMTPAKGWHLNAVRLNIRYLDDSKGEIWEEYINEKDGTGRYLYEDGSPFVEKDGVVTLKLSDDAEDSFYRVEVTFGEDTNAGIDFRTHGEKIEYRFSETEDFTELSGHYIDSATLGDHDKIQIRYTPRENETIYGVQLITRAEGMEDLCQLLPLDSNGIFTLKKVGFWKNYEIDTIMEDTAFDGKYRFVYDGNEQIGISGGRSFNVNYGFGENQAITFSFDKEVYGVVAWPNWRGYEDVEKVGNEYQYTPESKAALTFYVFMTKAEYDEFCRPKFRLEYDEWRDDNGQPRAYVSINAKNVENGREYSYDVNKQIIFMMSCPDEREEAMPIVEIECYDGDFYSSQEDDEDHKITITNGVLFIFTPTSDRGFCVRIWWSEYDKIGPDGENDELMIETVEPEGGSLVAEVTEVRSEKEPGNGNGFKQIVKRSNLKNDSVVFTITPEEGWRLREVKVWSPDQPEERYTIRKDENPNEWKPINEENGFTVKNGVYTYTLENVSRFGDRHVKVEAWFDKISDDWIKDGEYWVNYGDYGRDENDQPRAKVLVNDSVVFPGDKNKQTFKAGVALTFKLMPSSERAGCQPIVEIRTNLGEQFATWFEDDHKITLSKDLTFTFTPATEEGFEVNVWWADYDCLGYDYDEEFLVALDCWQEGKIEVSKEVAEDKIFHEPNNVGGIKRIYANSVLDAAEGLKITITPNEGYHVSKVWFDLGGNGVDEHYEYVTYTPGEGQIDLFSQGSGFSEHNGVVSYYVPKSVQGRDLHIGAEFQKDPSGIEINTWGGTVAYRIGTTGGFTAVGEDGTIARSVFEKASVVQIQLTPPQDREFKGVNYVRRMEGQDDDARVIKPGTNDDVLTEDGLLTINREGNTWPSISIELITWDVTYDGEYCIDNKGLTDLHLTDGREPWMNYSFTVNEPITFCFVEDVYMVRVSPNYRESFELIDEDGDRIYSYTPTENRALRFEVYLTEDDYLYEQFQPNHNENEFSLNYNFSVDDDVIVGTTQILTYGKAPLRTKMHGNQTRVILKDMEEFSFNINVPEGADYWIHVDGMDDDEATAAVKANGNTLVVNVSEPWNIPFVDIHVFASKIAPAEYQAIIRSCQAGFEGNLHLYFNMMFSDELLADEGAYVEIIGEQYVKYFLKDGIPTKSDDGTEERLTFPYLTYANEIRKEIILRVYDGAGRVVTLKNKAGNKDFTESGFSYSLYTYANNMSNSSDKEMAALAQATIDYGTAAQYYFGFETEGLSSLREEVLAVKYADLADYAPVSTGTKFPDVVKRTLTGSFEADNAVYISYYLPEGADMSGYEFKVFDTKEKLVSTNVYREKVTLDEESGKNTYDVYRLSVQGLAADELGNPYIFKMIKKSSGEEWTVTASVLTYARSSISKEAEDPNRANLGRALYLYNQAAIAYFTKDE